ncbi:MAG TPA: hypothetical protein VFC78_24225 [Tepidisphaeraceae bacterium]|nr:hypothetical protein [Tepidisphaeraceae bacterium]
MAKTTTEGAAVEGLFSGAVKEIAAMSPDAFRRTLVRLGISQENGKLKKKYARQPRRGAAPVVADSASD